MSDARLPAVARCWPAVGYLLLSVAFTWPMPLMMADRCWGHQWDLWGNLWAIGLFQRGVPPERMGDVFYPVGYDVLSDLGHFLVPLAGGLIARVSSVPMAYNVLVLALLVLAGVAGYALLRVLGCGPTASFAGGAVLAFNPYTLAQVLVGSGEMLALGGMAAFAASLEWSRRDGGWRAFVLGAGAWCLTFLSNIPYAAMLLGFLVLFALRERGRLAARWGLVGVGLVLVAAPYVVMLCGRVDGVAPPRPWRALSAAETDRWYDVYFGKRSMLDLTRDDLRGYAAWEIDACSVRWGDFTSLAPPYVPTAGAPWIGLLALALLAAWRVPAARFWAGAGGLALLLAMGPSWLPYRVLYDVLPGFSAMHHPYVFLACAWLALAVVAGLGLDRARWGWAVAVALLAAVAVPMLAPDREARALARVVPPFPEVGSGAVLEVPFMPLPMTATNARVQYEQLYSGQPTFNARLLRRSMWLDFLRVVHSNRFLEDLARLQEDPKARWHASGADLEALRRMGFADVRFRDEVDDSPYPETLQRSLYSTRVCCMLWSLRTRHRWTTETLVDGIVEVSSPRLIALRAPVDSISMVSLWGVDGPVTVRVRDAGGRDIGQAEVKGSPGTWRRAEAWCDPGAAFVEVRASQPVRVARVEVSWPSWEVPHAAEPGVERVGDRRPQYARAAQVGGEAVPPGAADQVERLARQLPRGDVAVIARVEGRRPLRHVARHVQHPVGRSIAPVRAHR